MTVSSSGFQIQTLYALAGRRARPLPPPPQGTHPTTSPFATDLLGYSTSEGTAGAAAASAATAATATTAATAIAAATVTTANAATSSVVDKAAAYALQGCSCERVKHEN